MSARRLAWCGIPRDDGFSATEAAMDQAAFEAKLNSEGYVTEIGELEAHCSRPPHAHPFDVAGMVLSGTLTLTCDGQVRTYGPGERYVMAAGRQHAEDVGAEGVRYLVGRRKK